MDARSEVSSADASSSASVTHWVDQLRGGDDLAAQRLWERFFLRMVGLARHRLDGAAKRLGDEEDVAVSAFRSFCTGARDGRFPRIADRDGLWALLMAIVVHKSVDHVRRENRAKRGGAAAPDGPRIVPASFADVVASEPSPEFAAEIADEFARLMDALDETGDLRLKQVVVARMEGREIVEIAGEFGCTRRTVERKLALVRRLWEKRLS